MQFPVFMLALNTNHCHTYTQQVKPKCGMRKRTSEGDKVVGKRAKNDEISFAFQKTLFSCMLFRVDRLEKVPHHYLEMMNYRAFHIFY